MKYWINAISQDHVRRGVAGGFMQANHGKNTVLKRLSKGDWIIFYSSRLTYPDGEPLQAFTAIGQVSDDEPYQFAMSPDFVPWRRNVDFQPCHEVPIRPLIANLSFIKSKTQWGYPFRFGLFEIPASDFERIKSLLVS